MAEDLAHRNPGTRSSCDRPLLQANSILFRQTACALLYALLYVLRSKKFHSAVDWCLTLLMQQDLSSVDALHYSLGHQSSPQLSKLRTRACTCLANLRQMSVSGNAGGTTSLRCTNLTPTLFVQPFSFQSVHVPCTSQYRTLETTHHLFCIALQGEHCSQWHKRV
jgi:hypothetical protein